jgi:hypothetical protein
MSGDGNGWRFGKGFEVKFEAVFSDSKVVLVS